MKRGQKRKTQNLMMVTATLSMFTIGITPSLEIFAEEQAQQQKVSVLKNEESVKVENRVFTVQGKGDVKALSHLDRRAASFSPFEPTGLYAKPNEEITIDVEGNNEITAYIGAFSYNRNSQGEELVKSFTLKPGTNTIRYEGGGMIYFYNKQENGTIRTTIQKGGTPVPYFELGKHTKQDLIDMLNQNPDSFAVELKGERVLITATPERVKKYLLGSNTDPAQLLKKMDEATRIQDRMSGLTEEQVDKHYIHYVEDKDNKSGFMYATEYRTAYVGDAIQYVLDINKFTTDGWGPWHEAGHLRQQVPWRFYNMGEVQNNIYSLAVEKAFGQPSRLEEEGVYPKVSRYLVQENKNYDEISDVFVKLAMLWQLHLAYGEEFYPKLHQLYRDMPSNEIPQTDETKKTIIYDYSIKSSKTKFNSVF
ncbi:enhancin-like peptidase M60 family [Bacillus sp. AK8]|nr:enhancin-like peptidase M60 family [Bacillus sp. AK8]